MNLSALFQWIECCVLPQTTTERLYLLGAVALAIIGLWLL